jgi:hypothetical protein
MERAAVERLATGWTTEGSELRSRQGQAFLALNIMQTGSGEHTRGGGGALTGDKTAG